MEKKLFLLKELDVSVRDVAICGVVSRLNRFWDHVIRLYGSWYGIKIRDIDLDCGKLDGSFLITPYYTMFLLISGSMGVDLGVEIFSLSKLGISKDDVDPFLGAISSAFYIDTRKVQDGELRVSIDNVVNKYLEGLLDYFLVLSDMLRDGLVTERVSWLVRAVCARYGVRFTECGEVVLPVLDKSGNEVFIFS